MTDRMGHSSTRAALIYMHGSDARQREIADTVSRLAQTELSQGRRRTKNGPERKPSHATGTPAAGHYVMTRVSRADTAAELGECLGGPGWT